MTPPFLASAGIPVCIFFVGGCVFFAQGGWGSLAAAFMFSFFLAVSGLWFYLGSHLVVSVRTRTESWHPVRETRGYSRAHVGDAVTACIPLLWSVSLLAHAAEAAAGSEDGTAGSLITVSIYGYQWGWSYMIPNDVLAAWRAASVLVGHGVVVSAAGWAGPDGVSSTYSAEIWDAVTTRSAALAPRGLLPVDTFRGLWPAAVGTPVAAPRAFGRWPAWASDRAVTAAAPFPAAGCAAISSDVRPGLAEMFGGWLGAKRATPELAATSGRFELVERLLQPTLLAVARPWRGGPGLGGDLVGTAAELREAYLACQLRNLWSSARFSWAPGRSGTSAIVAAGCGVGPANLEPAAQVTDLRRHCSRVWSGAAAPHLSYRAVTEFGGSQPQVVHDRLGQPTWPPHLRGSRPLALRAPCGHAPKLGGWLSLLHGALTLRSPHVICAVLFAATPGPASRSSGCAVLLPGPGGSLALPLAALSGAAHLRELRHLPLHGGVRPGHGWLARQPVAGLAHQPPLGTGISDQELRDLLCMALRAGQGRACPSWVGWSTRASWLVLAGFTSGVLDTERGLWAGTPPVLLPQPQLEVDTEFAARYWSPEWSVTRQADHTQRFRQAWGPLAIVETGALAPRHVGAEVSAQRTSVLPAPLRQVSGGERAAVVGSGLRSGRTHPWLAAWQLPAHARPRRAVLAAGAAGARAGGEASLARWHALLAQRTSVVGWRLALLGQLRLRLWASHVSAHSAALAELSVPGGLAVRDGHSLLAAGLSWAQRLQATGAWCMPSGVPIHAVFASRDVIHSWAVPTLCLKVDCVPGFSSHRRLLLEWHGPLTGQCMEVCGRYHHWMPLQLVVVPAWLFLS